MKKQGFLKKSNLQSCNQLLIKLVSGAGLLLVSSNAFASSSSSSLPFVSVIKSIADAISGPLALSVATIMIVATGLMNAFGEWSDGMKKMINIGFWCACSFGVASLITTFGGSGATF